jgi:hypothetical protein
MAAAVSSRPPVAARPPRLRAAEALRAAEPSVPPPRAIPERPPCSGRPPRAAPATVSIRPPVAARLPRRCAAEPSASPPRTVSAQSPCSGRAAASLHQPSRLRRRPPCVARAAGLGEKIMGAGRDCARVSSGESLFCLPGLAAGGYAGTHRQTQVGAQVGAGHLHKWEGLCPMTIGPLKHMAHSSLTLK